MKYPPRRKPVDLPPPGPPEVTPLMPTSLSPEELERVATFVFGSTAWKSPLARALGTTYRTVLRWADGTSPLEGPPVAALWLLAGWHPLQTGYLPKPDEPISPRPRRRPSPSAKIRNPEKFIVE